MYAFSTCYIYTYLTLIVGVWRVDVASCATPQQTLLGAQRCEQRDSCNSSLGAQRRAHRSSAAITMLSMADCASFETLVSPSTWRVKYWRPSNMRFWLSFISTTTFDSDLKSPTVILTVADLAIGAISCVAAATSWLRTGDDLSRVGGPRWQLTRRRERERPLVRGPAPITGADVERRRRARRGAGFASCDGRIGPKDRMDSVRLTASHYGSWRKP